MLLNLYAVHTVVLAHFLIPGDRLTRPRGSSACSSPTRGSWLLFAGEGGTRRRLACWATRSCSSALLLAERTVYLARAVHRLDPVKLLLSQAVIGMRALPGAVALFESAPTRWTVQLGGSSSYQGAVIAGFCFIVNLWLLERYRPSALATFFLTQPIFGVVRRPRS